jgi:hypothetical protein
MNSMTEVQEYGKRVEGRDGLRFDINGRSSYGNGVRPTLN